MTDRSIRSLQDDILRSKVEQARNMSIAEKLMAGPRLFDANMALMRAGIWTAHPEYSDDDVQAEVLRRLKIAKRLDDGDRYRPVEDVDG